jgi:hypothetical protein
VISGINNLQIKDRLLKEDNLNLEKTVKICKTFELTAKQLSAMQAEDVHVVKKTFSHEVQQNPVVNRPYQNNYTRTSGNQPNYGQQNQNYGHKNQTNQNKELGRTTHCTRCGFEHAIRNCPAYGKTCFKCKRLNHFGKCCNMNFQSNSTVRLVNHDDDYNSQNHDNSRSNVRLVKHEDGKFLGVVSGREIKNNRWQIEFFVNNFELSAKLDTGADVNVMPLYVFQSLNLPDKLIESTSHLTNFNGSAIVVVGKCNLVCNIPNIGEYNIEFEVVKCMKNTPIVIGWVTIDLYNLHKQVGIIQKVSNNDECNTLVNNYVNVFQVSIIQSIILSIKYNSSQMQQGRLKVLGRFHLSIWIN